MRFQTEHGVVEGDAAEIAQLLRVLQGTQPTGGTPQPVLVVPHATDTDLQKRLKAPPSNEQLLHDYANDVGIGKPTRRHYMRSVEDLEYQIAPKSLLDVTVDDVRAFEARALNVCALRKATVLAGRNHTGSWKVKCNAGLYDWAAMQPAACSPSCKLFKRQTEGPNSKLQGIRHFFDWLLDRGLVLSNPVAPVQRRHNKTREQSDDLSRYSPTILETRQILGALVETKTPRDVAMVLTFAKLGRRSDHTLSLFAEDARGLMDDGPFYFDFTGPRERIKRRKQAIRTKLRANLIAPADEELRAYLRGMYMPWRQQKWGYAWNEGPLFPGLRSWREPFRKDSITPYVLAPAMRHLRDNAETSEERERWTRHMDPLGAEKITAHCFRHFFTTLLEELGASDLDMDVLRGDRIRGAKSRYMHLTPEKICAKYRSVPLLSDGELAGGARQARLPGA